MKIKCKNCATDVDINVSKTLEVEAHTIETVLSGFCSNCLQEYYKRLPKPIEIK